MLTLDEIRRLKKQYHYTNAQLAVLSGVPLATVQKVLGRVTKSPRYETLQALSAVFESRHTRPYTFHTDIMSASRLEDSEPVSYIKEPSKGPNVKEPADAASRRKVQEPEPAYQTVPPRIIVPENTHYYPNQGNYTIDDYLALPDDQRVELIDGVIYDMGAPTIPHQLIGGDIYARLLQYVRKKGGRCMPFIAPTDVQLDCDNRTMVQPDVLIVCDRSKIGRKRIFGAPDFAAEVLSPSTKRKDILIKGHKYADAGVKEYWLIDPMAETVMVFDFREDDFRITNYTFEDKVPVLLYDGDCVIDFKEIKSYYAFLDEEE